jgi:hypothetical protein
VGPTRARSSSGLDVVGIGLPTITLAGSTGSGLLDCTVGAGECQSDADCNNRRGTCGGT